MYKFINSQKKIKMKNVNCIIESWMSKNLKNQDPFFKKLLIFWPKIVGAQLSRYSVPHNFIITNNQNILLIHVFNGWASIQMQSIISNIKNQILLNIGYQPVKEIKIIQKINHTL